MSERAGSQLVTLANGQTFNFDVSLSAFAPPYTVIVLPPAGAGTLTREILAVHKDGIEESLVAGAAVPLGAALTDHVLDQSWTRLRVKLVAGATAPGPVHVQINGVRR